MRWTEEAEPATPAFLAECCASTFVATLEPRSGRSFDAVLLACDSRTLLYELWSDDLAAPSGELGVIGVDEIQAVRVY